MTLLPARSSGLQHLQKFVAFWSLANASRISSDFTIFQRKKPIATAKKASISNKANGPPAKRQKVESEDDEDNEMEIDDVPKSIPKPPKVKGNGKTIEVASLLFR